jgi:large subunit ribosomal protein L6
VGCKVKFMSRLGKKPIAIPEKTEVIVKGPLGVLTRDFKSAVSIKVVDKNVILEKVSKSPEADVLWGTYSAHLRNMVKGVNEFFQKKLVVEGIGFKSDVKGEDLNLSLGFSHPVKIKIPKDLKVTSEKNVITIVGSDIEKVGQFAAKVRSKKEPEPYKGKGIHYEGEVIRRKEGKKTA